MRKITLSLGLALMALGLQAQDWTAPALKVTTDAVPESGYLYHIGQEMFFTKGTTWGTHAALTKDANSALLYKFEVQQDGAYKLHCAQAASTGYLGRSTEADLYTDYNNQAAWGTLFDFVKVGSYFHILTNANDNFGASKYTEADPVNYGLYKMGWSSTNDDVDNSGNSLGTNIGIFMLDPALGDEVQLDWGFVLASDYDQYAAKTNLYNKLLEAAEVGANTDAASAVYNNPDATIEEINEVIAKLNQAIADIQQGNASEDNPIDMTEMYLVNADFSEGSINGWTNEPDENGNNTLVYSGDNFPNSSCNTTEENNNETFSKAIAGWVASSTSLADDNIYQTIAELPAGKYVFTCSIVAQHGADMPKGVYLYAQGMTTSRMQVQHDEDLWAQLVSEGRTNQLIMHPELEIVHAGGPLTVGLELVSTNCNWVYADNFKLICKGQTDMNAYALALTQALNEANVYLDEDAYWYSEETFNTLEAEVENATDLLGNESSDEEMQASYDKLNALVAVVKTEVEAYNKVEAQLTKLEADMIRYNYLTTLVEKLEGDLATYEDGYNDRTLTTEQINAWIEGYNTVILEAVKDALANASAENPVEITALAQNMDFANNSTTEGWTVTAGNISGHGNYAVSYNVAEMWNNTFTAMQTVENLPAGKYILKAKAFYRTAGNAEGYEAYINGKVNPVLTYLVVGENQTPVVDQAVGAINATEIPYTGYAETAEGSGIWLPNSMQAASWAFSQDDTYACEASGYLIADGALTFGLQNSELQAGNAWSIWGDLRLYYCGKDADALVESLTAVIEQASSKQEELASICLKADEELTNAIDNAYELIDGGGAEEAEVQAAIDELKAAIQYADEALALFNELLALQMSYDEKMTNSNIESSYTGFEEVYSQITNGLAEEQFESNEMMKELMASIAIEWTRYIQYDHLKATKDAPEDITAVLVNPSFDQGTNDNSGATGWTFEYKTDGGHIGIASAEQQVQSNYAYEFWKVEEFKMSQSIVGLAEGYYRVKANAMYRAGGHSDAAVEEYLTKRDSVNDISLFANDRSVKICNLYDKLYTESTGADGEKSAVVDGQNYYVIGTMGTVGALFSEDYYMNTVDVFVKEGETLTLGLVLDGKYVVNNWCLFDNFQLLYLGNGDENAPTAIESVEANTNADTKIYDITGRRVSKAVKGIYIINGVKTVVK